MDLLSILVVVLIIAWVFGGFVVPIGGSAIHLLLVLIAVIIVIRLVQGRGI